MKAFLQNLTKQLQPFQPVGVQSGAKAGGMAEILNLKSLKDQIYIYILQGMDVLEAALIIDGTTVSPSKSVHGQCSPMTLACLQSESNMKSEEKPQGGLLCLGISTTL